MRISAVIIIRASRTKPNGVRVSLPRSNPAIPKGLVGFGVDGIAQYGVRLDGGRGKSGAGGIDFFKQEDDGRAKSDLAKFGATAKMRISNTVLSYGNQRPELPIVNADNSRLLFESFTGTMLTSKETRVWK